MDNQAAHGFLVGGFVERAPNVDECLASKTWTSLTGLPRDRGLTDSQGADFAQAAHLAQLGPHAWIERISRSPMLRAGSPAQDRR